MRHLADAERERSLRDVHADVPRDDGRLQPAAARVNISALVNCTDFPQHLGLALPTDATAAVRYDFSRLYAWDKLLASSLGKAGGVRTRRCD